MGVRSAMWGGGGLQYNTAIFLKIIFLSIRILLQINVMLDIILWASPSCEKLEQAKNSKYMLSAHRSDGTVK